MKVFAVRERGTNKYLPHKARSIAFTDPVETENPRTLHNYNAANGLLIQWCKAHNKPRDMLEVVTFTLEEQEL